MADNIIAAPETYVTSPSSGAGSTTTVGTPIPATQPVENLTGNSLTLSPAYAEKIVAARNSGATTVTLAAIGNGQSSRLLRASAGSLTLTWTSGFTVNGVTGAGSASVATSWKSIIVTQISATEFTVEGNLAS